MARTLRIEYEGAFYHITSRGNERKKIFFSKTDYQRFKSYLESAIDKYEYRLHAYVLMGNHYHLLIETSKPNLNKLMHYINGSYTNYINRRKDRSGHLFQGRYKAILIDRDNYLSSVEGEIKQNSLTPCVLMGRILPSMFKEKIKSLLICTKIIFWLIFRANNCT